MKPTAIQLFKIYEGDIDWNSKGSVKLPNYSTYYDKNGYVSYYDLKLGQQRIDIPLYKKYSDISEADALRLLANASERSSYAKKANYLTFRYHNRIMYVNPEGWFAQARLGGMGNLVVGREMDVCNH